MLYVQQQKNIIQGGNGTSYKRRDRHNPLPKSGRQNKIKVRNKVREINCIYWDKAQGVQRKSFKVEILIFSNFHILWHNSLSKHIQYICLRVLHWEILEAFVEPLFLVLPLLSYPYPFYEITLEYHKTIGKMQGNIWPWENL